MNEWTWCYQGYAPDEEPLREALCTVGNGYLATRGAAPECPASGIHYPGTYAAGVFNRLRTQLPGGTVDNESLVNLPNWLPVTFRVSGGQWFDIDTATLLDYEQCLDLREAVLTRWLRVRDGHGRVTTLRQRRFVSMGFRHCCALETTITPENWSGRLEIRSGLDGRVANTLVVRYRELSSTHLAPVRAGEVSRDSVLLETRTNQSGVPVAMAARHTLWRGVEPREAGWRLVSTDGWIGHHLTLEVDARETVRLEKVVAVFTGRDRAISEPAAQAARWLPRLGRFEELRGDHTLAWRHLWQRVDTGIHGDAQTQQIVRLHLLHLLQTLSGHAEDLDVGVPARGLHGEAYRGHIFWDELFVLPVLNLRIPALTRSLLRYRHRRLPEARQAARDAGYRGAMYPWQSGSDGREETQQRHLNPRSGRWRPDTSHRQRHIGIAVAYNVWQYYQTTGDREFLVDAGAEMLVEIARFWASIADYDGARDRYVIRGVMGPDEFHTGYPGAERSGIDNNAYTNVMAVWVLRRATETLDLIPRPARAQLVEALGVDTGELARWDEISHKMFVPFHEDGIISQFEGYDRLAELDWDGYRRRYGNIQRLDRILEAEDDDVNGYRASKQADALMLFYLLSADELRQLLHRLGYPLPAEVIPRTIDYYLARTSHGSTLSAVVHAWVLARAHRDRAAELLDRAPLRPGLPDRAHDGAGGPAHPHGDADRVDPAPGGAGGGFFGRALRADVADIQGGTTAEGIHLAAMAGSIDLLQRCFTGWETRADHLLLNPALPESLGVLELSACYRGQPLLLRVDGRQVEVTADPGMHEPIAIVCRGEAAELAPGATVRFGY